jgi:hypothetical protein
MSVTSLSKEFIVVRDLYKETKKGSRLLKKNAQSRMRINLNEVYMVEEIINDEGKTITDRCGITIRDKGFIVVKAKYDTINIEIFGTVTESKSKIGFKK